MISNMPAAVLRTSRLGDLFSFQKGGFYEFFRKTYKAEHYKLDLMRLAYSQSWGHILDRRLKVTVFEAEKVSLEYNILLKEIRDNLKDNWDHYKQSRDDQKGVITSNRIDVAPHCVCARFVNNDHLDSYDYIGTSKLSCTGC